YKIEALAMFEEMEGAIQDQIATTMYHVAIVQQAPPPDEEEETPPEPTAKDVCEAESVVRREQAKVEDRLQTARASHGDEVSPAESQKRAKTADGKKIGRNDPCPCGSGKKYKNCCGRNK
ncbi:SEC-C metal-binding domain-containing protein, partial [Ralstonia pseudosolanacearum]|uniref:SEC-C metal-binding domain-containing protein n=1 Tax=Ralstonia pseudosolanacearum TaxID=1310165 RepID=UPI003CE88C8E